MAETSDRATTTDVITLHVDYAFADLRELNLAHAKRERRRTWWVWMCVTIGLVSLFLLSTLVGPQPARRSAAAPATPAPASSGSLLGDVLVSLAPYVLVLLAVVVVLRLYLRSLLKRAFDERNPLQRRHVIEISRERLTDREPFSRHEYQWEAINKWVETPNLLLLYVSANAMVPLPKRSFASPEQVEQCRQLLREVVDTPRSARQAFPVLPAAPLDARAPLPAPPLESPPLEPQVRE